MCLQPVCCPAAAAGSTAKRRGPMDEMRQLQRILTKLLPGSIIYMPNQDGGGNKVGVLCLRMYGGSDVWRSLLHVPVL
jgi:hypothetical protein